MVGSQAKVPRIGLQDQVVCLEGGGGGTCTAELVGPGKSF